MTKMNLTDAEHLTEEHIFLDGHHGSAIHSLPCVIRDASS